MALPYNIDKTLVRKVMRVGGFKTQAAAMRAAILWYIVRRLPPGETLESYLARLERKVARGRT